MDAEPQCMDLYATLLMKLLTRLYKDHLVACSNATKAANANIPSDLGEATSLVMAPKVMPTPTMALLYSAIPYGGQSVSALLRHRFVCAVK